MGYLHLDENKPALSKKERAGIFTDY